MKFNQDSNLSCEEFLRMHGFLNEERINYLLDCEFQANEAYDRDATINEAMGCFPESDFLVETRDKAKALLTIKRLPAEAKEAIGDLLTMLDEVESKVYHDSEYANELLRRL